MAKRTIEQFRAEKGLWLGELAEKLNMTQEELSLLEDLKEVPKETAEKIIKEYSLSEDYFTFDPDAKELRYTPKKPFFYFFGVSFIWLTVFYLIAAVVSVPLNFAAAMDFEVATSLNFLSSVCQKIIFAFSGVYLTSYINRKTSFTKEVRKYDYIYPYLSGAAVAFFTPLTVFLTEKAESANGFLTKFHIFIVVLNFASLIIQALFCAYMLYAITLTKDKKQSKSFALLCGVAIISTAVSIISSIIMGNTFTSVEIVNAVVSVVLLIAVSVSVIVLDKTLPKLQTLWLTVLPLLAIFVPEIFNGIKLFG